MHRPSRRTVLASLGVFLAGCTAPVSEDQDTDSPLRTSTVSGPTTSPPGTGETPVPGSGGTIQPTEITVGYPHLRETGNRVVAGVGEFPDAEPLDVSFDATPEWLTAVPSGDGSAWAVVDADGTLSLVAVEDGEATVTATDAWPSQRPAVVRTGADGPDIEVPPSPMEQLAPPLVLEETVLAVTEDGSLAVPNGEGRDGSLEMDLLPDARLCRLDEDRVVTLGGPTTRYDHGALGDSIEASDIVVIDVGSGTPTEERRISVPEPRVVEGVGPLVTDLGGDRAIVVTESGPDEGARLVAYAPDGTQLASGEPIGTGFRWRHQLAVAPFGPGGERELAVVKTPHVDGTVEFHRRRGSDLEIAATAEGASSHAYGSRNLDGGLAADADGDGRTELLAPNDGRTELLGVERRGETATVEWSVPVGGTVSSNLVGVPHGDGLAVGVGHDGGTLRIWR